MTVESAGFLLSTVTQSSKTTRRAVSSFAALFNRGKGGIIGRINQQNPSSRGLTGDLVVTASGTTNVAVAAGEIWFPGSDNATDQGMYCAYNSASINLAIAATSTNPRKDLIIAQVRDNDYGDGTDDCRIVVLQGTAASSPVDPTLPANSVALARVTVPASTSNITSGMVTDLRPVIYGPVQFPGGGVPTSGASAPSVPTQMLVQGGTIVVTTNAFGVATISFPFAFPNGVQVVVATNGDPSAQKTTIAVVQTATTTSSFQIAAYTGAVVINTGFVRVEWFALGF